METAECPGREKSYLREYLRNTNVRWVANLIDNQFEVTKGKIRSLAELGNMQTLWSDLGGLRSKNLRSSEKFRVRDVIKILESLECSDKTSLKTIQEYIARLPEIKLTITVRQEDNGELRIYDGNKRAVAFYEAMKGEPRIDFEFFLLKRKKQS